MNSHPPPDDDEIDLRELMASIFSGWKTVLASVSIGAMLSAGYAVIADPVFQAEAIFELKASGGGPRIPAEYAGLASMAGISVGGDKSEGVFDRLVGRDFILRLAADLDLAEDEFFNPTGPISPMSLTGLKLALGFLTEADIRSDVDNKVVETYLRAVKVTETKNGSIEVTVSHEDPERAARVANGIVARVVAELAEEEKREQREQLSYLSDQLADALTQMEASKKAVAEFALANSLASPTAFATRSELMFNLREDLRRARDMATAVAELTATMNSVAAPGPSDYLDLQRRVPIIDDVDFRRLIGVPEALDAFAWPPRERLGDFRSTLSDRIARIERSIEELRQEAELYASSTERLAALQREATVAEATYNVLIEQVKAQSLVTGYQGEMARFYQSATPPERPSSPRRSLILALGGVLGLFVGAGLVLLSALRSGRLYTVGAIADEAGAGLVLRDVTLPGLRKGSLRPSDMSAAAQTALTDLLVDQSSSSAKATLVTATAPGLSALRVALGLALGRRELGGRVAILSLGEAPPLSWPESGQTTSDGVASGVECRDFGGVDILFARDGVSSLQLLTAEDLHRLLSPEDRRYDAVIVAADERHAASAARAFARHSPYGVTVARPGATLRRLLEAIRSIATPHAVVSLSK